MPRIRITKPVRAALLDELIARGLAPTTPGGITILQPDRDNGGGWLEVPDAQAATAQQVVDAHDAAAVDAAAATRAGEDAADIAGFRDIYQQMRTRADAWRNDAATMPPAPLTGAQVRQRLVNLENDFADLVDIVARLGRYVGRH